MKTLIVVLTLVSSVGWAKESECKANCAVLRTHCVKSCDTTSKNKKEKASCVQQGCAMAVQQCEGTCKGPNEKRH